ncbi:MAG TPA: hypothetical protein VE685_11990 [Thermoanaerobaculia bacterium]|nr:hypothetical protein [Thermoanaerobaculia bacterium]
MTETERAALRAMREALTVLALPPSQQVAWAGAGCAACELMLDFYAALKECLDKVILELSFDREQALGRLAAAVDALDETDTECFCPEVLDRPGWRQVRQRAAEALEEFGWTT